MKNRQLKRCISLLHSEAAVSVRRSNETLRSGLTAVVFVTVTGFIQMFQKKNQGLFKDFSRTFVAFFKYLYRTFIGLCGVLLF